MIQSIMNAVHSKRSRCKAFLSVLIDILRNWLLHTILLTYSLNRNIMKYSLRFLGSENYPNPMYAFFTNTTQNQDFKMKSRKSLVKTEGIWNNIYRNTFLACHISSSLRSLKIFQISYFKS